MNFSFLSESKEQITITSFPENYQFFARGDDNKANINISGFVNSSIDSVIIKVYHPEGIIRRSATLSRKNFSIDIKIEAIKHNYTMELYTKSKNQLGKECLVKKATHITVGDVYVINGQSNAWAIDYDNIYKDSLVSSYAKWIRTIGAMHVYNKPAVSPEASDTHWYIANGKAPDIRNGAELVGKGMVGVLGMNIGLNLVASQGIPIAIINGAGGGGGISFYQKTIDNDLNTPYGRLYNRLEASGLKHKIKAFIWNQGENNAGDSVNSYKDSLNKLYSNFKLDYTFEKFYLIQTPPGCNSKSGHQTVREAQRQFADEKMDVCILTRHGFTENPHTKNGSYFLDDGCHYHAHGYKVLASWISSQAEFDFYKSKVNFEAPRLINVKLESSKSLSIEFDKQIIVKGGGVEKYAMYSAKDYLFASNNKRLTTIEELVIDSLNPRKLTLISSIPIFNKGDKITHILSDNYPLTQDAYQGPWLINPETGVGAVGFTVTIK
ncbi:sialate O-acetylesterase [Joostella sp.]|uniref:sialate O-acetylesterase n=1 Tax=Joostella sp. TaxID=2231138 RepID=UPI003A90AF31